MGSLLVLGTLGSELESDNYALHVSSAANRAVENTTQIHVHENWVSEYQDKPRDAQNQFTWSIRCLLFRYSSKS